MDADRSPTNVRVVPDLGDELLIVIDRLGALLGSVAIWEIEDDVGLPAPFADGKALGALQAVADVVRPTQGRDEPQLVSGRLPRRGWTGRRLPLHFVPIPDAPLATLEHAVQILAVQRAYHDLNAAVEQYTAVVREPPLALVSCLSRTVSLLTLPWDDDVRNCGGQLPRTPTSATPSSVAASSKPTTGSSGASTISGPTGQASTNRVPDAVSTRCRRGRSSSWLLGDGELDLLVPDSARPRG